MPFIGSIKWRENSPFDPSDLTSLSHQRSDVPGAAEATLVAVGRTGCTAEPDAFYSPTDLLHA